MSGRHVAIWLVLAIVIVSAALFTWQRDFRIPKNIAYLTEENGEIAVIDLQSLAITKRIRPPHIAPRGLAITPDGKYLITADKDTADIAVFSTPRMQLLRRLHIGDNPEFVKIDAKSDRVFATFEPGSSGGPPTANDDEDANEPPAQIASFHIGDWTRGPASIAGQETEGLEFSPDGKWLLVSNEAQNNIGVFDEATGAHIRDVNLKPYGIRPRGIKVSPLGDGYAVTMESSGTLLRLDPELKVVKSVQTAAKPYGVAFDRSGKRIFVAAAGAGKLQVFSGDQLQLLAEVPVGRRCWHFTFTPDDAKILMACGRSNDVVVIDANSYKPLQTISGLQLPWGIVTYPRAFGSLGLP